MELVSGVLLEPLDVPLWSEEFFLFFFCFFLPVLVSVELFWSLPVPEVPLAVDPVLPLPDWPLISELEPLEPVPLVEPVLLDPLPDWPAPDDEVPDDCAAAIPIEKMAAVAIARSFFICISWEKWRMVKMGTLGR